MSTPEIPSLFATRQMPSAAPAVSGSLTVVNEPRGLMDLFYPGFYMFFLLKTGYVPQEGDVFRERARQLMNSVDRGAQKLQLDVDDVMNAKFAFSALLDEIVLGSSMKARDEWERRPMQLELFGEHLAGDRFFDRLEALRGEGVLRLGVLEVFHMCLLLGFKGRHAADGTEKLGYITARLGDEITRLQGRRPAFAPRWAPPDRISHQLRSEVPLWALASVFAALALTAFVGLRLQLVRHTERQLGVYADVVKLAPQPAYITLQLP